MAKVRYSRYAGFNFPAIPSMSDILVPEGTPGFSVDWRTKSRLGVSR